VANSTIGPKIALQFLNQHYTLMLWLVGGGLLLQILTFPLAEDLVLRNIIEKALLLISLFILLSFSGWARLHFLARLSAISVLLAALALGVLSASKTAALTPVLAMVAGLWLSYRGRWIMLVAAVSCIVFYFGPLAPTINAIRNDPRYDPRMNSLADRVRILSDLTVNPILAESDEGGTIEALLTRFSATPFQSFLINEYREGRPGDSLADSWTALVPRALWPEKPIVTRFGLELYERVFQVTDANSILAPTYTGEAYWNYGWIGLVGISILLGIEVGWFSRKWMRFALGGRNQLGILVFSVPAIMSVFWVETWIAASYIGGFATLLILIKLVDWSSGLLTAGQVTGGAAAGGRASLMLRPPAIMRRGSDLAS